jgi:hypothetical protein
MPVTIDNISRLLETLLKRQSEGNPTFSNIKNGFDSFKITIGTDNVNFEENYDFCIFSELIIVEKKNLVITDLGYSYLGKSDIVSKKIFLRNICIGDNKTSQIIFSILDNFNFKNNICYCDINNVLKFFKKYEPWIELLHTINFWKRNRSLDTLEINPIITTTDSFKRLMKKNKLIQNKQRKSISLVDQERNRKNKEENDKITGRLAEEIVEIYEKKRLDVSGFHDEANNVKQISDEKSTLGYDIESFFGKADDITVPDKLIEVKGTTTNVFRFFWSKNEIKTAQKLRQNYWIYFVSDIDKDKKTGNIIRKIQDPFEKIFPLNYFDKDTGEYGIECDSYIISDKLE